LRFPTDVDWITVIIQLREEHKNYEGIAHAVGIPKAAISYLGSGNVKNPGYQYSAKILNHYVYLYGDDIPLLV